MLLTLVNSVSAQRRRLRLRTATTFVDTQQTDTLLAQHARLYADSLENLIQRHRQADSIARHTTHSVLMNPYCFQIFSVGTVYSSPLQQAFAIAWQPQSSQAPTLLQGDYQLATLRHINRQMATMYAQQPALFLQTQQQLTEQGSLASDINTIIKPDRKLTDQIQLSDLEHDVTDTVTAITRRPNFWKFKGSSSLQFTQSYFSDNWFQGGEKNYAGLTAFTIEAIYDNKQKVLWENKLEVQLGFQTAKSDTLHSLKVTSNLLRFTTKLGYKAAKTWFYSTQFQTYTQIYPNYQTNTDNITTDFASPLYMSLGLGLDYKLNKKRFNGSLGLYPVSVNARYVDRPELRSRYNDSENQKTKWTFGPNVTINFTWKITDDIQWQSRAYWFSDFRYTNIEWENTFSFTVNKYISCRLFLYPKFLDNNKRYKNEKGRYWMFKEWLSLGLSYNW